MSPEEVAARYDNRTGYRLVSYDAVGLPVFQVIARGLFLDTRKLDPIDEFILRSADAGLETVGQISGFLGLDEVIIESCLVELLRNGWVSASSTSTVSNRTVSLTPKGREVIAAAEHEVPVEKTFAFCWDGLTRKARFIPHENLIRGFELRSRGTPEVSAFPRRKPHLDELDLKDVADVIRLDESYRPSQGQLLQIESIEKCNRKFIDAVALAYQPTFGSEIQVGFSIDGRLSVEHESAFARANGIEKSKVFRGLLERKSPPSLDELVGEELSPLVHTAQSDPVDPASVHQDIRDAKAQIREALGTSSGADRPPATTQHLQEVQEQLKNAELMQASLPVRPLAVYEHAPLLRDAIETAAERLLIISPWIRSAVVDQSFVQALARALGRGVQVYIDYGLGEDRGARDQDREALKKLELLARSATGFSLSRSGYTHAKVLIKDRELLVISSFNWLSFKGDPHRTFREEWGTKITIPEVVDRFFAKVVDRFDAI